MKIKVIATIILITIISMSFPIFTISTTDIQNEEISDSEIIIIPKHDNLPVIFPVISFENICAEKSKRIMLIEDKYTKIIEYKDLINTFEKYLDPPIQIKDVYSDEELYALYKVVETEVYDCGFDEKCNIASVVMNRLKNGKWGNTLQEVCYAENQFAYWRTDITDDTILACEYVYLFGDTTNGCLYFQSAGYMDSFCGADYVFADNAVHYFYR